jgi:hypothetical protein
MIRDSNRFHAKLLDPSKECGNFVSPIKKRILTVEVKVYKWVFAVFCDHECIPANVYDSKRKRYYDLFYMMMQQIQFSSGRTMSMPVKIAAFAFGLVLFLPILALLIVAGIVASLVFGVLMLVGIARAKTRSLFGKDDEGRKNVRIKR